MLDIGERHADLWRQFLRQQQAEDTVEFVHRAVGLDTRVILRTRVPSPRPVLPSSPVRV